MAKSGFWLSGARGKLAGAALQKTAYGDTMIRQIVTPKNPQTQAQLIQRAIINSVAKAYSLLKPICDHSFEGISYGAKSMGEFFKINSNLYRQKLREADDPMQVNGFANFGKAKTQWLPMKGLTIAQGSLPTIKQGIYINGFEFPADILATEFMDNNRLLRGDQITFVTLSNDNLITELSYARIIFKETVDDTMHLFIGSSFNRNAVDIEGNFDFSINQEENKIWVNPSSKEISAGAIIVSRKQNEVWLRSNATLDIQNDYLTEIYTLAEALATRNSNLNVESRYYLNNAENLA